MKPKTEVGRCLLLLVVSLLAGVVSWFWFGSLLATLVCVAISVYAQGFLSGYKYAYWECRQISPWDQLQFGGQKKSPQ